MEHDFDQSLGNVSTVAVFHRAMDPGLRCFGVGRPSYTKETLGGGGSCETVTLTADQLPVVEVTEADVKTMEEWAVEILAAALIHHPTDDPAA